MSVSEAETLAKLRGFALEVLEYRGSEEFEEGQIIFQTPIVGTKGNEGDVIQVVVSSGSDYETVPNLVGLSVQDAIAQMQDVERAACRTAKFSGRSLWLKPIHSQETLWTSG